MAEPITWEALGAVVAVMGGLGMATVWIVGEIGKSRRESADGRDKIYRRLDEMTRDINETFARREVVEADFRTINQALEEQNRLMTALAGRICPYERKDTRDAD
ncbi:hypothetical protein [Roseospira goensis]|uniref:Uncharacterized protein n=1 Tax=Roseospira goensis TaxID=391922 RepID=A0A7W6S459_9PROT|nr:hypothetical protein [Roseospira goensis]MBB4287832.1 hypothetical protein [Roseospira goensis]